MYPGSPDIEGKVDASMHHARVARANFDRTAIVVPVLEYRERAYLSHRNVHFPSSSLDSTLLSATIFDEEMYSLCRRKTSE